MNIKRNGFNLNLHMEFIDGDFKIIYFDSEQEAKSYLIDNKLESKYRIIKTVYIENDSCLEY